MQNRLSKPMMERPESSGGKVRVQEKIKDVILNIRENVKEIKSISGGINSALFEGPNPNCITSENADINDTPVIDNLEYISQEVRNIREGLIKIIERI